MRTLALLLILLTTIVIRSFGQTDLPKYYCQGCCGGVGIYYLKLDSASKFELYYFTREKKTETSSFGLGTFNVNNDILTLSFDNIPQDGVNSTKVKGSDSLIVHFRVIDNIHDESVALTNVKFKTGEPFFFSKATGTIQIRFSGPEIVNFSSVGYRDISYSLTEPGEYEMEVRLNPQSATYLKQGDKKDFKVIRRRRIDWLEDIDDKKLKFTTRSCGR
jgi:hypothetical protein